MILSDTLNQPLALAIYAALGTIFGIIFILNAFACAYLIRNPIYRHVSQCIYTLLYGFTFFLVTLSYFDYDLKIYHILICLFFTTLTSTLLYLPIRKHNSSLLTKGNAIRSKIAQSKIIKKFKK
ncbi:MAG: hypothetical protein K2O35_00700 [Clostridia bacterium]|nr:hypothetical protein [Clostridia bacterium]